LSCLLALPGGARGGSPASSPRSRRGLRMLSSRGAADTGQAGGRSLGSNRGEGGGDRPERAGPGDVSRSVDTDLVIVTTRQATIASHRRCGQERATGCRPPPGPAGQSARALPNVGRSPDSTRSPRHPPRLAQGDGALPAFRARDRMSARRSGPVTRLDASAPALPAELDAGAWRRLARH
jgi:hypothetical protein